MGNEGLGLGALGGAQRWHAAVRGGREGELSANGCLSQALSTNGITCN